jgi:hypothetical protein
VSLSVWCVKERERGFCDSIYHQRWLPHPIAASGIWCGRCRNYELTKTRFLRYLLFPFQFISNDFSHERIFAFHKNFLIILSYLHMTLNDVIAYGEGLRILWRWYLLRDNEGKGSSTCYQIVWRHFWTTPA